MSKQKENKKPLVVYLDYNVFVSLQEGQLTVYQIKAAVGSNDVKFVYSPSHIEEVRNIKDRKDVPKLTAINERLKFIDAITKKQYLERVELDTPYKRRSYSAFNVYDNISGYPMADQAYKDFNNIVNEDQKQFYRTYFGLDSKTLNNISPAEIIPHLNDKLTGQKNHQSFDELVKSAQDAHSSTYKWGVETNITVLFSFLDLVGYWKDKVTETSNVARFWDSSHCGFATFCDVLVSQDERMRLKSEVAYKYYGINTKIVCP